MAKSRFLEIGSAGLRQTGGYVSADFLPQLVGTEGARRYTEMASNDPLLSGMLFAIEMLIRQIPWKFEARDEDQAENAEIKEKIAFAQECLVEKMETGLPNVMSEVASMFTYGYAPMEVVYLKRDDGNIGIKKISLRAQDTIEKWEFNDDTGELLGLWQQDWIRPRVFIPRERFLLFRTQTAKSNPEGRSILRGAYVTWMRKRAIEEAEGRAALRAAGIVVIRVPGSIMETGADQQSVAAKNAYTTLAQKLAEDRQGAVLLPSDKDESGEFQYDVNFVVADGKRSADMTQIIERMDKRMASVCLADFILLGQQAVGSFALSENKTTLFTQVLQAWAELIADTFNRELFPAWWKLNGWDEDTMPKMVAGELKEVDLTAISNYVATLGKAGMMLFPDEKLEAHLRKIAALPEASPELLEQRERAAEHEAEMEEISRAQAEADITATEAGAQAKAGTPNLKLAKED